MNKAQMRARSQRMALDDSYKTIEASAHNLADNVGQVSGMTVKALRRHTRGAQAHARDLAGNNGFKGKLARVTAKIFTRALAIANEQHAWRLSVREPGRSWGMYGTTRGTREHALDVAYDLYEAGCIKDGRTPMQRIEVHLMASQLCDTCGKGLAMEGSSICGRCDANDTEGELPDAAGETDEGEGASETDCSFCGWARGSKLCPACTKLREEARARGDDPSVEG